MSVNGTINPAWIADKFGRFSLTGDEANKIANELDQDRSALREVGVWKICGTPVCKRVLHITFNNKQLEAYIETGRLLKCLFCGLVVITGGIFGIISCFWQAPKDYFLGKKITIDTHTGSIPLYKILPIDESIKKLVQSKCDALANKTDFVTHYRDIKENRLDEPLRPGQYIFSGLFKSSANDHTFYFTLSYNNFTEPVSEVRRLASDQITYRFGAYYVSLERAKTETSYESLDALIKEWAISRRYTQSE